MSIFSKLFQIAAPVVGGFIGGPAGFAIGSQVGQAFVKPSPARSVIPQLRPPGRPPALPGLPRLPGPLGRGLPPAPIFPDSQPGQPISAFGQCPPGFHLNKQRGQFGEARTYCVRNRRMNVTNSRAAMRAIRRIKGARKVLQKIERMLPKTKGRSTPRHGHRVRVEAT